MLVQELNFHETEAEVGKWRQDHWLHLYTYFL